MFEKTVKVLHVICYAEHPRVLHDQLLQDYLSPEDKSFHVTRVDGVAPLYSLLNQSEYDVLLLDTQEARCEDDAVLQHLASIQQYNPDLPVIVYANEDNEELALSVLASGGQEYLVRHRSNSKIMRMAIYSAIQRKSGERVVFKQANYDALTGLPNYRLFQAYVEQFLRQAQRGQAVQSIMVVAVDKFDAINAEYGYEVGNAVLKKAAVRITNVLRSTDIVARCGGGQFAILLEHNAEDMRASMALAATKLLYACDHPFQYNDHEVHFTCSIGVAFYPQDGLEVDSLIQQAGLAMQAAQRAGGRQFSITPIREEVA